ncbi:cell-to-cell movement protein [Paederia scandens chlorosis yellow umbravirus]|nr:cell-to-cell movement protein [Paederia scandens chlorosis yellow umbravirus]
MSTTLSRAESKEQLLSVLYGEVTLKELEETQLGILTPVRGNAPVVLTPLLPPKTQTRISSFLRGYRPTRNTGGLLFVEKIVAVFTPHVPDDAPGEVEIWVHDTMLPHLNSVGQKVRVKLNEGPKLIAFYPPYSLPLRDTVSGMPRCFSIVTELSGASYVSGSSPFSLLLMWQPRIESVAHHYLQRPPSLRQVCRHQVKDALMTLSQRQSHLVGAMSSRYATNVALLPTNGEAEEPVEYPPPQLLSCDQRGAGPSRPRY